MNSIVFRADASVAIGSGHVMRCLTLADALDINPRGVLFVCADLPGHLAALVRHRGYAVQLIAATDDAAADAELTSAAIRSHFATAKVDWLAVDHYGLGHAWESAMRADAVRIVAIDDFADRVHDCDLLLDQNLTPDMHERYRAKVPPQCRFLLGPEFALLRPEFAAARAEARTRDGRLRRLLVSFGGSDPTNETAKTLEALGDLRMHAVAVDVVVGSSNPNRDVIESMCRASAFDFHCQTDRMAALLDAADLCIGGGGTSSWERCCTGTPALVIALAANQVVVAEQVAAAGAAVYLGPSDEVSAGRVANELGALADAPEALSAMSRAAMALVDGQGAPRVAAILKEEGPDGRIRLRMATLDDAHRTHEWRNAPEVRAASLDEQEIPWADHLGWFQRTLASPDRMLLIAEAGSHPVGVLRYDVDVAARRATVSIYMRPGQAGKGLGTRMLHAGSAWLAARRPDIQGIDAVVRPENLASRRAFIKAGFLERNAGFTFEINRESTP